MWDLKNLRVVWDANYGQDSKQPLFIYVVKFSIYKYPVFEITHIP